MTQAFFFWKCNILQNFLFVACLLLAGLSAAQEASDVVQAAKNIAYEACQVQRDDKCIALLLEAESLAPEDVWVTNGLGWAYFNIEKYDEALAYAARTLELEPKEYRAHGLKGRVYIARKEYAEAADAYEAVLDLNPGDGTSIAKLTGLAMIAQESEDWAQCLRLARRAVEHTDNVPLEPLPLYSQGLTVRGWMLMSECEIRVGEDRDADDISARLAVGMREKAQSQGWTTYIPEQFSGFTEGQKGMAHRIAIKLFQSGMELQFAQTVFYGLGYSGYMPATVDRGVFILSSPDGVRDEAMFLFRLAADKGDPVGQVNLGAMLWTDPDSRDDRKKAVALFGKSAEQGNALACHYLSLAHKKGKGVRKDRKAAKKWAERANDAGWTPNPNLPKGVPEIDFYELPPGTIQPKES